VEYKKKEGFCTRVKTLWRGSGSSGGGRFDPQGGAGGRQGKNESLCHLIIPNMSLKNRNEGGGLIQSSRLGRSERVDEARLKGGASGSTSPNLCSCRGGGGLSQKGRKKKPDFLGGGGLGVVGVLGKYKRGPYSRKQIEYTLGRAAPQPDSGGDKGRGGRKKKKSGGGTLVFG